MRAMGTTSHTSERLAPAGPLRQTRRSARAPSSSSQVKRNWGRMTNASAATTPTVNCPRRLRHPRTVRHACTAMAAENQTSDEKNPTNATCGHHRATSVPTIAAAATLGTRLTVKSAMHGAGTAPTRAENEREGEPRVTTEDQELECENGMGPRRVDGEDPGIGGGLVRQEQLRAIDVTAHVRVDGVERRLHTKNPLEAHDESDEEDA